MQIKKPKVDGEFISEVEKLFREYIRKRGVGASDSQDDDGQSSDVSHKLLQEKER